MCVEKSFLRLSFISFFSNIVWCHVVSCRFYSLSYPNRTWNKKHKLLPLFKTGRLFRLAWYQAFALAFTTTKTASTETACASLPTCSSRPSIDWWHVDGVPSSLSLRTQVGPREQTPGNLVQSANAYVATLGDSGQWWYSLAASSLATSSCSQTSHKTQSRHSIELEFSPLGDSFPLATTTATSLY